MEGLSWDTPELYVHGTRANIRSKRRCCENISFSRRLVAIVDLVCGLWVDV